MQFIIRPYHPADLPALQRINAASTPGVSEETVESLAQVFGVSWCVLVADSAERGPIGLVSLVPPKTESYLSPNLRWFEIWQSEDGRRLIYIDRIAVAASARGFGVGERLYTEAFKTAQPSFDVVGCEVNTRPDNPGSHRFHQRLGFVHVGQQTFSPQKAVAYYVRTLT